MTVECRYTLEGRWKGQVLGFGDIEHLVELKRVDGASHLADDLKG